MNDFDEAAVGPASLDLVRCTTSIFLATEQWRMSPTRAAGMALAFLDAYRATIAGEAKDGRIGQIAPRSGHGPIWELLAETAAGSQQGLLEGQTRQKSSGKRMIRRTDRHPGVGKVRAREVAEAIEGLGRSMGDSEPFEVLDVTGRVAGLGSLGLRRYLVLVRGREDSGGERLFDVKEVVPSALTGAPGVTDPGLPGGESGRVVGAQAKLQAEPTAGLAPLAIGDRPFRVREMIPEENRASLERLHRDPEKLALAVAVAGKVAAWSQLRGADFGPEDNRSAALVAWASGPTLDAILAASARCADRTRKEFLQFSADYRAGLIKPPVKPEAE